MQNSFWKFVPPLLRVALGWLFLYAGLTKVLNPGWTSKAYLEGATTLHGLYVWMTSPGMMQVVDFLNTWGLTLLGLSLILGIGMKISTRLGALLMVLYYLPILAFPMVGAHSFLVDEHVIYALLLLWMGMSQDVRMYSLAPMAKRLPFAKLLG
jgi:thiosulfate dehydrogenase [quinone] large subunit